MKKNVLSLLVLSSILVLITACSKKDLQPAGADNSSSTTLLGRAGDNNNTTYYGPVVQIGNGQLRSFAVLEKQTDKPEQIGFELTAGGLTNLPSGHEENGNHQGSSYVIKLHPKVQSSTVFDHLVADWNAQGHQPGPYLSSHFDFHFYMLPLNQRLGITATDPLSVAPIPTGYLPNFYIGPLGPEPQMGGHCVDVTSPELNGSTFTHTFIYGAYNSKVAFYEPMITHDYLSNGTGGTFEIKQPAKFSKAGYYPTKYSISKNAAGTRYVVLTDFVYRNAN